MLAGLVEYDGARFAGWAAQPDRRTVEGELTEGLRPALRHPLQPYVARPPDARAAVGAARPARGTGEGQLAEALRPVLRQPIKLSVAGRTDAGVHASGQVVSFEVETDLPPSPVSYKTTAGPPDDA